MRANDNMSDKSDKKKDGRAIKIGKKKIRIKKAVKNTVGDKNTSDKKNTPKNNNKTKRSKKQIWMNVALIVCGFFCCGRFGWRRGDGYMDVKCTSA